MDAEISTDKNGLEVSTVAARAFIQSLEPKHVLSVYAGKFGCNCGCRGKHSYNPLHGDAESLGLSKDANFSSRSVSIILRKVQRSPHAAIQNGHIVHYRDFETDRQYAVYLAKSAELEAL